MATTPANSMNLNSTTSGLVNWDGDHLMDSTALTQYNVLSGASPNTIHNISPTATSGVPLISQGSFAPPSFATAVVAGGGTGDTSFTAYSVICGGTTSTGALQNVSGVGTSGQVLTSNGAGMLPTWQTAGGVQILKSSTIDFTSATLQPLLTTPSSGKFILLNYYLVSISITGWSAPATYNFGYTAANYYDLQQSINDGFGGSVSDAFCYQGSSFANGATGAAAFAIPASTTLYFNVIGAGTATTYTAFAYLIGVVQF